MLAQLRIEARERLIDASFATGCGCEECRNKREYAAALEVFQSIYPELLFVPGKFTSKFAGAKRPRYQIEAIINLAEYNNDTTKLEQFKEKPKPLYFCQHCGRLVLAKDSKRMDGHRYCKACLIEICKCKFCGEMHDRAHCYNSLDADGNMFYICTTCRRQYNKCNNCNTLMLRKEGTRVGYSRNERGKKNFKVLCSSCIKLYHQKCAGCGGTTYGGISTTRNGHSYCPSCMEESAGIASYNYKPLIPRFRKAKKEGKVTHNAFHMGFELEVADHHSLIDHDTVVHLVKEHVGRKNIYAMSDGSISGASGTHGAEFASHPFTWQYYKETGYAHWDKLCLKLREFGWRGNTPGLGIHIHTTKAAWGTHQIYKLLKFINTNKRKVQQVSQRGATIYNNYDYMSSNNIGSMAKEKKQNGGHGHYQCVNLNQGETGQASKTIEFRMFQSTLEPLYFHKNIEFVYALWKFTQECSLKQMGSETKPGWAAFIKWLWMNKREYPCLVEFINMKGIK